MLCAYFETGEEMENPDVRVSDVERKNGIVQRVIIALYIGNVRRFEARFVRRDPSDPCSRPYAARTLIFNEEGRQPVSERLEKSVFAALSRVARGIFGEARNAKTKSRGRTRVRPGSGFAVGDVKNLEFDW